MFKSLSSNKRFLGILAGLILIAGQLFAPAGAAYAQPDGAKASGTTVLAFSSDVHNKNDDLSADRLASWIDTVEDLYGKIDAMGFGGDLGKSQAMPHASPIVRQAESIQALARKKIHCRFSCL